MNHRALLPCCVSQSKGAGVRVEILDMLATVMAGLRRRQADQRKADLLLRKWSEKIEGVNEVRHRDIWPML